MPGLSCSTTKPFTLSSSTSRAQITTRSANVPLPIQRFSPVEHPLVPVAAGGGLQPARDVGAAVRLGEPERADLLHPAIAGSQRSRCSGEPHRSMLPIASPLWMPKKLFIDGSVWAISIETNPMSSRRARRPSRPS